MWTPQRLENDFCTDDYGNMWILYSIASHIQAGRWDIHKSRDGTLTNLVRWTRSNVQYQLKMQQFVV